MRPRPAASVPRRRQPALRVGAERLWPFRVGSTEDAAAVQLIAQSLSVPLPRADCAPRERPSGRAALRPICLLV